MKPSFWDWLSAVLLFFAPVIARACPDGSWVPTDVPGRCFKVLFFQEQPQYKGSWIDGMQMCVEQGAVLATLHTEYEDKVARMITDSLTQSCWIGVRRYLLKRPEKGWIWVDDSNSLKETDFMRWGEDMKLLWKVVPPEEKCGEIGRDGWGELPCWGVNSKLPCAVCGTLPNGEAGVPRASLVSTSGVVNLWKLSSTSVGVEYGGIIQGSPQLLRAWEAPKDGQPIDTPQLYYNPSNHTEPFSNSEAQLNWVSQLPAGAATPLSDAPEILTSRVQAPVAASLGSNLSPSGDGEVTAAETAVDAIPAMGTHDPLDASFDAETANIEGNHDTGEPGQHTSGVKQDLMDAVGGNLNGGNETASQADSSLDYGRYSGDDGPSQVMILSVPDDPNTADVYPAAVEHPIGNELEELIPVASSLYLEGASSHESPLTEDVGSPNTQDSSAIVALSIMDEPIDIVTPATVPTDNSVTQSDSVGVLFSSPMKPQDEEVVSKPNEIQPFIEKWSTTVIALIVAASVLGLLLLCCGCIGLVVHRRKKQQTDKALESKSPDSKKVLGGSSFPSSPGSDGTQDSEGNVATEDVTICTDSAASTGDSDDSNRESTECYVRDREYSEISYDVSYYTSPPPHMTEQTHLPIGLDPPIISPTRTAPDVFQTRLHDCCDSVASPATEGYEDPLLHRTTVDGPEYAKYEEQFLSTGSQSSHVLTVGPESQSDRTDSSPALTIELSASRYSGFKQ